MMFAIFHRRFIQVHQLIFHFIINGLEFSSIGTKIKTISNNLVIRKDITKVLTIHAVSTTKSVKQCIVDTNHSFLTFLKIRIPSAKSKTVESNTVILTEIIETITTMKQSDITKCFHFSDIGSSTSRQHQQFVSCILNSNQTFTSQTLLSLTLMYFIQNNQTVTRKVNRNT